MDRIKTGKGVTDKDVDKLQSLHLDVIERKHGKQTVLDIEAGAIHLFFTNEKRCSHNLKHLAKVNSNANPTAVLQPISASSTRGKGTRSHFSKELNPPALLCRGVPVCIKNRNFLPLYGLHNGACGFVEEIVFAKGRNPNEGDLPEYVVVDFPLYKGPAWDKRKPTRIPVPMCNAPCKYRCCQRKFCPLELCFARTIHKFQGLEAGPDEPGKPRHMYKAVVCDPDSKTVEQTHLGLLYTAISRGTTLGDESGLNSAVYFTGNNLTRERIQRINMCLNTDRRYVKVAKRQHWVDHLKRHTEQNRSVNNRAVQSVFSYFRKPSNPRTLHERVMIYTSGPSQPNDKREIRGKKQRVLNTLNR